MQCRVCGQQCARETGQSLNKRINKHRADVTHKRIEKPVSAHFNLPNHSIHDIEVMIIEQMKANDPLLRKIHEMLCQNNNVVQQFKSPTESKFGKCCCSFRRDGHPWLEYRMPVSVSLVDFSVQEVLIELSHLLVLKTGNILILSLFMRRVECCTFIERIPERN